LETSRYCYLCGNSDMIYEAYALLRKRGVPHSRIFAEVYF
jgi:ferredoxin--NADP+ reductase/benzoate/toluate 1,2-dioxygenase reductase subunit